MWNVECGKHTVLVLPKQLPSTSLHTLTVGLDEDKSQDVSKTANDITQKMIYPLPFSK